MFQQTMATSKRLLRSALQGFFVLVFFPLLCLLPHRWGYWVARRVGTLNFRRMHYLRKEMIKEMQACLPERTEEEIQQIALRAFQVQATFLYDSYLLTRYSIETWTERFIRVEGAEHIEASRARGKGVIFCSMHFNHYFFPLGILGKSFPMVGYGVWPGDLLKVPFYVRLLHQYLIWLGKRKSGAEFLAAGRHPKGAVEGVLGDNKVLFILVDVALPEMRDLRPVKFFGQDFVLPWGLIMVKYLTQAAFHIGYIVRDPEAWEKQTLIISPELQFIGKLAQDHQTVASELEKVIRQYPEFWWGWGMLSVGRPEAIREARRKKDYSTTVLGKQADRAEDSPRK